MAHRRRLATLHAALAPEPEPEMEPALRGDGARRRPGTAFDELCWRLAQGTLETSTLSQSEVRALMAPSPDKPTQTESMMASLPEDLGLGASPRPLLDAERGTVAPETVEWLLGLREGAVMEHDFQRAAYIHQLYECVRPNKPPLTLTDCAPEGPDAKAAFFLENVSATPWASTPVARRPQLCTLPPPSVH